MNEIICQHCNAQSPENAFYCQQCGQPLRCKDCRTPLLPTARACTQCGKLIPERSTNDQLHMGMSTVPPGYNIFNLHETPDVRDLGVVVSDVAIAHIGDFLPYLTGNRPKGYHHSSAVNHLSDEQTDLLEVPSPASSFQPQLPSASSQHDLSVGSPEVLIWEIFTKEDGGALKLDITSLKASGKWDYIMRLVYLYLYAKIQLKEDKTSRTEVYALLENLGLLDANNISRSISKAQGISSNEDGTLRLNYEGRKQAQEYITEVFNNDLPVGWLPSSDARPASNRTKKPAKKSGERRNDVDTNIQEWVTHNASQSLIKAIPHNNIVSLSTQEKGLLSLYTLNKVGIEKEVPISLIKEFLYEAFKIDVLEDTLRKALDRAGEAKRSFVNYRKGQGYRITPSGCDYLEEKLKLKQPQNATAVVNA